MSWLDRFRGKGKVRMSRPTGGERTGSTRVRAASTADQEHLAEFIRTRTGVEGFVEPRTAVSEVTLLLVAVDGEWTRRRVPGTEWAHRFANSYGVPSYDAGLVGIPQRMRDWNTRNKGKR